MLPRRTCRVVDAVLCCLRVGMERARGREHRRLRFARGGLAVHANRHSGRAVGRHSLLFTTLAAQLRLVLHVFRPRTAVTIARAWGWCARRTEPPSCSQVCTAVISSGLHPRFVCCTVVRDPSWRTAGSGGGSGSDSAAPGDSKHSQAKPGQGSASSADGNDAGSGAEEAGPVRLDALRVGAEGGELFSSPLLVHDCALVSVLQSASVLLEVCSVADPSDVVACRWRAVTTTCTACA